METASRANKIRQMVAERVKSSDARQVVMEDRKGIFDRVAQEYMVEWEAYRADNDLTLDQIDQFIAEWISIQIDDIASILDEAPRPRSERRRGHGDAKPRARA